MMTEALVVDCLLQIDENIYISLRVQNWYILRQVDGLFLSKKLQLLSFRKQGWYVTLLDLGSMNLQNTNFSASKSFPGFPRWNDAPECE